ncbi:trehalose-phosphatase [Chloroflexota bacterium]
MEHLLSVWPMVAQQLRDARHILLLTDYDGTLTPIVEKPELANLSEDTRRLLRNLARQRHFTLGVISGRALADLKEKVGISGIIYAGNHGLEIEGLGIRFVNPVAEELRPILRIMHHVLSRALYTVRGVSVENKGLSLSIHYRLVEKYRAREVERIVKQLVSGTEAAGQTKLTSGKKVYEVRPAVTWDKGKAIKLLMKKYGKGGRESGLLSIYFGDDLTDEAGFRVIEDYGMGISVFVGEQNQHSTARYFLKSPAEVAAFLGRLLEQPGQPDRKTGQLLSSRLYRRLANLK